MTEPINLQVNVLQGQDMARASQADKDIGTQQVLGQEVDREEASDKEVKQVHNKGEAQDAELNEDGSARGRAFMRPKGKEHGDEDEEENDERTEEPDKGVQVDFLR